MRRLTAWIGGVAGGVAAYKYSRRRRQATAEPTADSTPEEKDARAEELREKLAESRVSDEPSPVEPGEPEEAVEERRQRVHDEGRAALDEMTSDDSAESEPG